MKTAPDLCAAIFDLDQTLVDSRKIEQLRKARRWKDVYARIPTLVSYDGLAAIIARLKSEGVLTAIVTSSPQSYCSKVLLHCGVEVDTCVCYHDTKCKKPHAEPMLLALQKLGVAAERAIAIGDGVPDIQSAKAAGIYAVAATWGLVNADSIIAEKPDAIVHSVAELRDFLYRRFSIAD